MSALQKNIIRVYRTTKNKTHMQSFIINKDANTIKGAIKVESFIVMAKVENINNIIKYFSNLKLSKVSVNFKK